MNKRLLNLFYLIVGLIVIYILVLFAMYVTKYFFQKKKEGFQDTGNYLEGSLSPGAYPASQTDPLLKDSYPLTGRKGVSNNQYNNIWWHYPVFKVGSYEQITNNIKYPNNPDEGTCISADFCGALYKESQSASNISEVLPPVPEGQGARVNYYRTDMNLLI
jgi:hypothetical protein